MEESVDNILAQNVCSHFNGDSIAQDATKEAIAGNCGLCICFCCVFGHELLMKEVKIAKLKVHVTIFCFWSLRYANHVEIRCNVIV